MSFMSDAVGDDKTVVSIPAPWQTQGLPVARSCPKCGLVVTDNTMVCPVDNTAIFEAPGRVLADSYEFMSVSGWGGMSVIYKARRRDTGNIVAIKMLHSLLMTEQSLRRFQQEAKAIMSLRHPNIITVHDFGVSEHGQPYMVMDFIEGKTLADVIKENGGLSLEASLPRFIQLCDALDHAHSMGVLHRDLKPSNVMISNLDGNFEDARIVDFGIAKLLDKESEKGDGHLTQTGELFGSPLYMSPEQCRGSQVDGRTDIYSMGCVMYETLTGRPPFMGATIVDTLMMQMANEPDSLQKASAGKYFSSQIEEVIATTLAKSPADRYQTMQDLVMALMSVQPNKQNFSKPLRVAKGKKTASVPMFVYGAGIAFGVVALVFIVWWQQTYKPDQSKLIENLQNKRSAVMAELVRSKQEQDILPKNIQLLLTSPHNLIDDPMLRQTLQTDLGLTELNLNDAQVGDNGCNFLQNQRSLKNVYLDHTFVGDHTVHVLTNLPDLEKISLHKTKITDRAFAYFPKSKYIFGIYLKDSKGVGDETVDHVTMFPTLKELDVSNTAVTDSGCKNIHRLALNKFWASDTKFGDEGMVALAGKNSLTDLYVAGTNVTDEGLSKLTGTPKLAELDLSHTKLTDKGMSNLSRFPNLRRLVLSSLPIIDSGMEILKKLRTLEQVNIASTKITNKSLQYLSKLPMLSELNLRGNQITDDGMDALIHVPSLKRLNLADTKITDVGLKKLLKIKNLEKLVLLGCDDLTLPGIVYFKDHHPDCDVEVTVDTF
jgi:serine/threonine protein kinase